MIKTASKRFQYFNSVLWGVIAFFLMQTYFRLDRIEEKQNKEGEAIARIEGALKLSQLGEYLNLTKIEVLNESE